MLSITLYLVIFLSLIIIFFSFKKRKELIYVNPFFYFLSFTILYLGIPAIFVAEIRAGYYWSFTNEDIIFSNILVILSIIIFTFLFYTFNKIQLRKQSIIKISPVIKLIWFLILMYILYVILVKYQNNMLFFTSNYLGTEDTYKLKNIGYLLVTISTLYYFDNRKIIVFIPNLLIAILDILEGSRTTAFIVLIPIFINLAIYKKKTYLGLISTLLFLLVIVGMFRNENTSKQYDVPVYIDALGEFRETYILLPNIITNEEFVGTGDFLNIMSSISLPFLQPLREELLQSFKYSGSYAARLVGRGYGLGNNFLVESIYYGYFFIFINILCIIIFLYVLHFLIQKINLMYSIILVSYSVIFIRLIVREGFINNFGLMLFVLLFYMLPCLIINKYFTKIGFK